MVTDTLHHYALKHDLNLIRGYYNSSEYFICLSTEDLILNSKKILILVYPIGNILIVD